MPSYAASSASVTIVLLLAAALSLTVGYWLQRSRALLLAWLWLAISIVTVDQYLVAEGAGLRMLALVAFALYAMKALVATTSHRAGHAPLRLGNWLAFAAIWLGMQPREFARRRRAALPRTLLLKSSAFLAAGIGTIRIAQLLYASHGTQHATAIACLFLLGCSMALHFGVIGLTAALLQWSGYRVTPQFRAPWLATDLQEFWARRWNVGFSVMTSITIFRPLKPHLGKPTAMALAFLASGLLHELACSLPVAGCYCLPSCYFLLQAVAIWIERRLASQHRSLRGIFGRLWVYGWILLPAPLVFHAPFLRGLVMPLL